MAPSYAGYVAELEEACDQGVEVARALLVQMFGEIDSGKLGASSDKCYAYSPVIVGLKGCQRLLQRRRPRLCDKARG